MNEISMRRVLGRILLLHFSLYGHVCGMYAVCRCRCLCHRQWLEVDFGYFIIALYILRRQRILLVCSAGVPCFCLVHAGVTAGVNSAGPQAYSVNTSHCPGLSSLHLLCAARLCLPCHQPSSLHRVGNVVYNQVPRFYSSMIG